MEWQAIENGLPPQGKYIVNSSYGITLAYRHDPAWANCFQDIVSGNDEGMRDQNGLVFRVTHWMPLPVAP